MHIAYESDLECVTQVMREVVAEELGEAIVRYLVHPKESGRVKTRLTTQLLARLNAEPGRVLFPRSNLR